MDDDFAFSDHATLAEWEEQQREYAEFGRRMDEQFAAEKELQLERNDAYYDPRSLWRSTFVLDESGDLPLSLRLLAIGFFLAEIIADLKVKDAPRAEIDSLHQGFENLRHVLNEEENTALALLGPVIERFRDSLLAIAARHADGTRGRCEDLAARLLQFTEPRSEPPTEGYLWEGEDGGDILF